MSLHLFNIGVYFKDAKKPIEIYTHYLCDTFENACKELRQWYWNKQIDIYGQNRKPSILSQVCQKHLRFRELDKREF